MYLVALIHNDIALFSVFFTPVPQNGLEKKNQKGKWNDFSLQTWNNAFIFINKEISRWFCLTRPPLIVTPSSVHQSVLNLKFSKINFWMRMSHDDCSFAFHNSSNMDKKVLESLTQAAAKRTPLFDLSTATHPVSIVSDDGAKKRQIFIARHSERVDFVFGRWVPHCFDAQGKYVRRDLNMPKHVPQRANSPASWNLDSPITNVGMCMAKLTGDAMKDAGVEISYAYCSPAYRSVQTCHGILEGRRWFSLNVSKSFHNEMKFLVHIGLGMTHVKIRVDFALFEWMSWYQNNMPGGSIDLLISSLRVVAYLL